MAQLRSKIASPASPFLLAVGSVAILFHLGAVVVHVLAAPSGPWHGPPDGRSKPEDPPRFAQSLDDSPVESYLKLLKLTQNHFAGNRPSAPSGYLEVRLKDATGEVLTTFRFPDAEAPRMLAGTMLRLPNRWIRYQQELFAQGFIQEDVRFAAPQGEVIPAPGQQVPMVTFWDATGPNAFRLKRVPEHLLPHDRPFLDRPTDWALVLVHSYARYLCRQRGAAKVEIVRHSREAISPSDLLRGNVPPAAFTDTIDSYGDISSE
jgi:hypothetical protein